MRKIYSLVLMATMLLVGANAWADGVIEIVRNGATLESTYLNLHDAFAAAQDGDLLQLTGDINHTLTETDSTVWFGAPSSGTLETYANPDLVNPQNGYRAVTLDLKGNTYTFDGNPRGTGEYICIALTRGKLTIQSTGGVGTITATTKGTDIIRVYGTYLKIDGKENTPFTHLVIEENVILSNTNENAVTMERLREYEKKWWNRNIYPFDYSCAFGGSNDPYKWNGVANGVRIDIKGTLEGKKYGLKPSGTIRLGTEYYAYFGNQDVHVTKYEQVPNTNPAAYFLPRGAKISDDPSAPYGGYEGEYVYTANDAPYSPYIHIHSSAVLRANNTDDPYKAVGLYCAGYCRVFIEGHVEGSTGVYVKSGDVELHDATIESTYTGEYKPAVATSGGVSAAGSAIVIESNAAYTGNIDASVSGDTKATGGSGYAIDEAVTTAEGTEVDAITITGGTFVGGGEGTLKLDETTVIAAEDPNDNTTISIVGGAVANGQTTITVGDEEVPLTDFLADTQNTNTHITYVTDENNNTTMIISQGDAPAEDPGNPGNTTWTYIASQSNAANPPSLAWTAVEQNQQISSGTIYLGELQINSGSAGNLQELIIHDGATLQVERLIMNAYARIIVEAGGKLIVKGTQGISAPSVENIKLEASETAQALFLFHPEVSSNRHPNATVEFISNSITNNPFFSKQRFGIPTWKKLSSITTKNGGNNVQTAIASYSFEAHDWVDVSWINIDGKDENLNLIANPFEYYQMQHNTANAGTVVTMKGELYGNTNPTLSILGNSWNGYANSYMAPIDGATLIELIPDEVDKSFQIYVLDDGAKGHWKPASNLDLANINPMQAFLIGNTKEAANVTVDYWDAVYTPITGESKPTPNAAPARRSALSTITKAKMVVRGEGYTDGVVLAQDDQFSAEFDNSYDCRKYMNEGINLYVSADEKMGIFATDNLENTYVGFQSVNGGTYIIEFTDVQGEELTLIDHETGAQVLMVEGNTYAFTANGTNDYRFEVVTTAKIATGIENTEAVKNAKGIYTITGQYVGEMNVWNSLPAGIYVIDGAKRVK